MSAYPRPIHCVNCERDLIPEKNGVWLIEMAYKPPLPYKIWHADVWKCPSCGVEIISGYGKMPHCQHEERFKEVLEIVIASEKIYYNYERGEKE